MDVESGKNIKPVTKKLEATTSLCMISPTDPGQQRAYAGNAGGRSGFDAARDGIGFALLDLFVVAEDFAEAALEKLAQPGNRNDVERAPRFQVAQCVEQVNVQHFLADLGRYIGDDGVELLRRDLVETVTEHAAGIVDAIQQPVLLGVLDRDKILVDHQGMSLWCHLCHAQAEYAVTAAEVQAMIGRRQVEMIQ